MRFSIICAGLAGLLPCVATAAGPDDLVMLRILNAGETYCKATLAPIRCELDAINLALGAVVFDVAAAALPLAAAAGNKEQAESFLEIARRRAAAIEQGLDALKKKYPLAR